MKYPGFLGPSNATQSPYADAERLINWYPEPIQSPGAPTPAMLLPTPGFRPVLGSSSEDAWRALVNVSTDRCFGVRADVFMEVFANGTFATIATVSDDHHPATISYNGPVGGQLFVCAGGDGYIYNLLTFVWTQVLTGTANMGGMKDGRFLALSFTDRRVRFSSANNGLLWDPLDYFVRGIAPDPWRAMVVGNPEIWLIGDQTSEAWYNTGTFPNPYAPILSSFVQAGTHAPWSVALNGPSPVFLNHTATGAATIVQLEGFTPTQIGNYAVSTALAAFDREGTLDDCESFAYQEAGHTFIVFNFATARATWVFDATAGIWHERGRWVSSSATYDVWGPRVHCHAFGKHLTGNRGSGALAEMSIALTSELDGSLVRRLRIPPPIWAPVGARIGIDHLTLRLETGLGLLSGQGVDPIVQLRTSTDGKTWGTPRTASAGQMGAYSTQVSWARCGGSGQLWVPEITVSDPIPWRLAGCEIEGVGLPQAQRAA